jgi:hypothetical protein
MRRLPLPLLLFIFIIAFPVAVPIALVLHVRDQRRMQSMAAKTPCEGCGATLGDAALRAADEEWKRRVEALQHGGLMMRLRLVRHLWAICAACGAEYDYDVRARTFHRAPKGTNTADKT